MAAAAWADLPPGHHRKQNIHLPKRPPAKDKKELPGPALPSLQNSVQISKLRRLRAFQDQMSRSHLHILVQTLGL